MINGLPEQFYSHEDLRVWGLMVWGFQGLGFKGFGLRV